MKFIPSSRWQLLAGALAAVVSLLTPAQGLRAQDYPPAATLTNISQFSSILGIQPISAPVQAADGSLYGTALDGGAYNKGTIYRRGADGTITVLFSFGNGNALEGTTPLAGLTPGATAGTFYGAASGGGANGRGTVYKVVTDGTAAGTAVTALHSFIYGHGAGPYLALLLAQDGNLYGVTPQDGSDLGEIFSLSTDGSNFTVLYTFSSDALGYDPSTPLIEGPAGTFYGATFISQTAYGSLYTFTVSNGTATTPTVLHAFGSAGLSPGGNLVLDNGVIYGLTVYGGPTGLGAAYAISTDGTTTVRDPLFNLDSNSTGVSPGGGFAVINHLLYGITTAGGSDGNGTVFSLTEDGATPTVLHNFAPTDGLNQESSLLVGMDGATLYGVAYSGGTSGNGTLYQLGADGSGFNVLHQFLVDYQSPQAALVQGADGAFYGTSNSGGFFGEGRVFRVDASGAVTNLHDFSYGTTVGSLPIGASGVANRPANRRQTRAAAPTPTSKRQTKARGSRTLRPSVAQPNVAATLASDGANPSGALIQGPNGLFYGTTNNGGDNNNGTVFSISADGQTYTILHSFAAYDAQATTNADGSNPVGALLLGADGLIYGVTNNGGTSGYGTIYRFAADGTGFTVVHQFAGGAATPLDVAYPNAGLIQGPDGTFYGATQDGGINANGGVYSLSADGATLTVLHSFTGADSEGSVAYAAPVFGADGYLYGTTYRGGNFYDGTIYKVSTDGATFTTLYNFSGGDGNRPESALLASADGYLYGTTSSGGSYGQGVIYRLSTEGDVNVIYNFYPGPQEEDFVARPPSSRPIPAAVAPVPTNSDTTNGSMANLIVGSDGFFYGTSPNGGTLGDGSVYRVSVSPVITSAAGLAAPVNTPFSFTVTAQHNPTSFAASGLPAGLTIDPATGLISGTPTTVGTYTAKLTVANDAGTISSPLVIVVEQAAAAAPAITSGAPPAGQVGVSYSYQITATNSPTSFGATGLPAGLTLNPVTGLVSGTPTAGGTFGVTFLATNAAGTNSAGFTLAIAAQVPVIASPSSVNPVVGQPFSYQITASDNPTSFSATGLPPGLTVNPATGLISGTPTAAGTYNVTIGATNASGLGTTTLAMNVTTAPLTTATISSPSSASAQVGQVFNYQITASDNPTSFGATGLPPGLTVNPATGLISGTPTASGTFVVALSATNASGTGTSSMTLTVAGAAVAPPVIVSSTTASSRVAVAFSYQISASNTPTAFGASGLPVGLSINDQTGLISGTPTVSGTFLVTLVATNSGGSGTATLMLTIASQTLPVIDIVASTPSATVGSGQYAQFTVTRTGGDPTQPLTVYYAVSGTATPGTDYVALSGAVTPGTNYAPLKGHRTFKAGKTSVKITIMPEGTLEGAAKKTVKVTLQTGENYTLGMSTMARVHILAAP